MTRTEQVEAGPSGTAKRRRAPLPRTRTAAAAVLVACGVLLAGCTTTPTPAATPKPTRTGYHGLPIGRAAEPGIAPPVTVQPVGDVVQLPEGTHPWGVAVARSVGRVYLSPHKQDKLVEVDLKTDAVTTADVPGSARMIDLAGDDRTLLLPAEDTSTLYRLALPSLKVLGSTTTRPHPHQAAVLGDTTFISVESGNAVAVVRDDRIVTQLRQPDSPGGITAVAGRVAAVDVHTNTLFVWDATSLKLLAALPAGKGPSHVVPIGGGRVAVCDVRGNAVLTYDLSGTPRALGRAAVPGRAFWIEADPSTGTIYAALSNTNKIAQLHVDSSGRPVLTATVPTVRQPISMDLDTTTGTLFVGGYADSQLQVFPVSAFDG